MPDAALEQQPVGQGCVESHVNVQMPPPHPCAPAPQSVTVAQPHWPPPLTGSQACPCVLAPQPLQAPPLLPHWLTAVPATQVPPAQHPPLHGWVAALHWVVQRCVAVSHAVPAGQSPTELQPQNVRSPVVTHSAPLALVAQLTHAGAALVTPHAVPVLPCVHTPALQHPPLHPRLPAHEVVHACETGSHACPTRQSEAFVQPPPSSPASPLPPLSPESVEASPPSAVAPSGTWDPPSTVASTATSTPASRAPSMSPFMSSPHAGKTSAAATAHAVRAMGRLTIAQRTTRPASRPIRATAECHSHHRRYAEAICGGRTMDAAAAVARAHSPASRSGPAGSPSALSSAPAAWTLLAVATAGVALALLTWRVNDVGLGWLVADGVLVVAVLAGVGRARPRPAQWLLAGASLWLAGATAWYASDWAHVTALPASLVTLAMLAVVTARRIGATHLSDVGGASLDALRALPGGIADAARTPIHAVGAGARGHLFGVLRGALFGVPLAAVFALLLSADSHFRHALGRLLERSGEGVELGVWTAATTAGLLVAYAVLARLQRPRHPGGRMLLAPLALPYRAEGDAPAPAVAPAGPRVRTLTWGVVLAHVVAVFGVYVFANGGSLFVGHAHVRSRGTVTYAEYLHEGFMQVSVATLLAVACVVLGHVLLRPRSGAPRVAGGRALVAVELALLGLVGVTLASCGHRLALYEEAYGYTYLRLGVWLLQLGVAGLLLMTAARCLARSWRGWGTALVWSGVASGLIAGTVNADGWIARRNVARARAGASLDLGYLAGLSEDARGVLPEVTAFDRDAAVFLEESWGQARAAHRAHGWRSLRGLGAP